MFKGLKAVYSFTFMRNISEKTYKILTVMIALILFAGIAGVMVYLGSTSEDKTENNTGKIYIENNTGLDIDFNCITENEMFSKSKIYMEKQKNIGKKDISLTLENEKGEYCIYLNVLEDGKITDSETEALGELIKNLVDTARYKEAGIDEDIAALMINEPAVNISTIEDMDKSIGEIIGKTIFPMIFTIIMFIMIMFYGNSISRMMLAEKDSKLLETLLVTVYAKIVSLGKILAMFTMAVMQFGIWILSIIGGYFAGTVINSSVNPKYKSGVGEVIKLLSEHSGAFGAVNIIIAVVSMLTGFMLYCFWAGLISSFAKKIEELSILMIFYQIPVMIGYIAGLMGPIYLSKNVLNVLRLIPFTSVFFVPADVLIGNISCLTAGISVIITVVFATVMVYITGKMYKKNVFR